MTLRLSILIILICLSRMTHAQKTIVETVDIHNYWQAFDSVQNNNDYNKQLGFIKHLYIDRGTPGLKAFIQTRGYTDSLWLSNILKYPKFWASIRSTTLTMETRAKTLESYILKFKELYPQLKPAAIYFTIGGLNSGGTTLANQVLIGAEMISGSAATDVSEFDNEWLKGVFAKPDLSGIVTLNLHEYVHTQQRGDAHNVLGQSLKEGLCDFITELCIEKPLETAYLNFGRKHADSIRKAFTNDMFSTGFSRWLYNGFNQRTQADLGYYVGYEISKAYYQNAKNKGQAIRELIEVNYSDEAAVEQLLQKSGYITEAYNRGALLKNYQKQQPFVTELSPFKNDTQDVDPGITALRITFSKPMAKNISINRSKIDAAHFPATKIIGFENNNQTLVLAVSLKPNCTYDFAITNRSSQSSDGYAFRETEYEIRFKTKP